MYDFDTDLNSWHIFVRLNLSSLALQKLLLILSKISKMKNIWLLVDSVGSINEKKWTPTRWFIPWYHLQLISRSIRWHKRAYRKRSWRYINVEDRKWEIAAGLLVRWRRKRFHIKDLQSKYWQSIIKNNQSPLKTNVFSPWTSANDQGKYGLLKRIKPANVYSIYYAYYYKTFLHNVTISWNTSYNYSLC